jgi:DUF1009 family protein
MTARSDAGLCVIAGSGVLPLHVARAAASSGRPVFVAALSGSADPVLFEGLDVEPFGLGQLGGLKQALARRRVADVVMIGGIVRPGLSDIRPDLGLVRHLPALAGAFRKGDDGLLTAIIAIFEEQGLRIVSALDVAPELAAREPGPLGRVVADADARAAIANGLDLIGALSRFDVGQSVVVEDGRPVAIEGAEGTDAMLVRVADMRRTRRLTRDGRGVLIKAPKLGQEMRVDVPTIGPATVRNVADAGLAGIAIRVGQVLIADRSETKRLADEAGLFIEAVP